MFAKPIDADLVLDIDLLALKSKERAVVPSAAVLEPFAGNWSARKSRGRPARCSASARTKDEDESVAASPIVPESAATARATDNC